MTNMATAYSYIRFSTPEQALGDSARRQLAAARKYADANGLILDESLRDEGVSAYRGANRGERAALGGFLRRVESGEVKQGSYLLVESLDRLSRKAARKALRDLEEIIDSGIAVVTLSDGALYTTERLDNEPFLIFQALLVMMRSHEESALKGRRVREAWEEKHVEARATGAPLTAGCPAWLEVVGQTRRDPGRYEIREDRAEIIREIFGLSIDGHGTTAIAKLLNGRDEPSWGVKKKSRHWHDSYVQKILSSRATIGEFQPVRGDPIPHLFPAVIEEDTFYRARAAAESRKTDGRANGGRTGDYKNLFSKIATCSHCQTSMHYVVKGGKSSGPVLMCGASRLGKCTNKRPIDYDYLETRVLIGLPFAVGQAGREAMSDSTSAPARAAADIDVARGLLVNIEGRLAKVAEAIAAGAGESLAAMHRSIEAERDAVRKRLADGEIAVRIASDAPGEADLAVLLRRVRTDPGSRPAVASVVRRVVSTMTCDDAGKVVVKTKGGGRLDGVIRAHPDPKWNPGRLVSQDGRRRKDDPALVEQMAGGKEVATRPKIVRKRKNAYAPRTTKPAFGRGSDASVE